MQSYLPEKVSKVFRILLAEFIKMAYDFNKSNKFKLQRGDPRDKQAIELEVSIPFNNKDDIDPYVDQYGAYTNLQQLDKIQDLSEPEDIHFLRSKLKGHFTERMFKIIDEIQAGHNQAEQEYMEAQNTPDLYTDDEIEELRTEAEKYRFPTKIGSSVVHSKPALEFVKYI
jgi:hypothetical protein